jgi:hypothetical protein
MARPMPVEKKIRSPVELKTTLDLLMTNQPRPMLMRDRPAKIRSVMLCWKIASNIMFHIKNNIRYNHIR